MAQDADSDTYRRVQLMDALATHRADAALRAMVQGGSPVFLRAVDIRESGPPWAQGDLAAIEGLLNSEDEVERLHGINMCAFLGSEIAGVMLAPILEGDTASAEEVGLARGVLNHFGYYRPTFLPRLKTRMERDGNGIATASYLAWSGDADARAVVVDWLAAHPLRSLNSSELPIAFRLLEHVDNAAGARAFLKSVWKKGLGFGSEGQILSALAEAGDNEAGAALDALAYQKPRRGPGSAVAAIRALQKTSPAEALAAAERYYHQTRAETAAYLLLEFDSEAGAKILLDDYAAAPVPVRHRIGRLLRRRAPRTLVIDALMRMSASDVTEDRLAAAELAGWLPFEQQIDFLDRLVEDEAEVVEKAALVALRQRQADAECAILIGQLTNQPRPRQWAWLHSLAQRGDPAHLADPKDPRSVHNLLDQLGDDFREEANVLLEKRRKELEKAADNLEQDRRR